MVDLNPHTKTRKGFYVKMKFLHSNYKHGIRAKENHNKIKNSLHYFFHKFFQWVLWICLSFYLFISFPSFKHINSHKLRPRSLIQQSSLTKGDLNLKLKVYVYELPRKYNKDWLKNERCSKHLFASEVAIHKALLESDLRTFDPNEANYYFVPVYVSCNFSTINGFPAIGHARSLISSAIDLISSTFPFWNRTRGSDHVFVASHDFGACFHTLEDVAISDGIPDILSKSIILQTFGVKYKHPCQEVNHVVIPPYIPPESIQSTLEKWPLDGQRDIFAFFRGKMELNPKNVSGRFYSKAVRTQIWRKYNNDPRFYLKRNRYAGYQSEIARSIFCLCPLGWAPWSPRLVESVALGCVPVIIADGIQLPYDDVVPWAEISLVVAENDIVNLGKILEHVVRTNLTSIQRNLWDQDIRRALLFHGRVQVGDATWNVLHTLDRGAHTRFGVSGQ